MSINEMPHAWINAKLASKAHLQNLLRIGRALGLFDRDNKNGLYEGISRLAILSFANRRAAKILCQETQRKEERKEESYSYHEDLGVF